MNLIPSISLTYPPDNSTFISTSGPFPYVLICLGIATNQLFRRYNSAPKKKFLATNLNTHVYLDS